MMNAPLILETAALFLVAFVVGATVGVLARRLTLPRPKSQAAAVAMETKPEDVPQLVVAPTIAPIAGAVPRRSAAERLAAAAGRDLEDEGNKTPSRTAGDATGGVVVPPPAPILDAPPAAGDSAQIAAETSPAADVIILPAPVPETPAVVPEAPSEPVLATDVPPIDEAAQVVERTIVAATPHVTIEPGYGMDPDLGMPVPLAALEAEPSGPPALPMVETAPPDTHVAALPLEPVDEGAAMRAIEGGDWRPRRTAPGRPVQHPEQAGSLAVEEAMANTRSAVASAAAAAAAAIAGSEEASREQMDFDAFREEAPESFLDTDGEADATGLQFEATHLAFGRPEALAAPRDGEADNLRQINGITPQLESSLHQLGVYHFDQIANWDQKAMHWVDTHLSLKGRVAKEKWLEQARDLSAGRGRTARPVRR